ncbi:class I SAM-dependent methyltransferase [Lentzea sp.]|uniref:class I SAM-dependent methyltransferase n=1 Tax=Lentzea sp. TaxID=56099 RepID=UPI002CADF749|nr:class I SAM-dependent methyltransferase [Lentzea sp.]HUQ60767.1 class I SAM-dependent methyltransferase [Lentzea sp.]
MLDTARWTVLAPLLQAATAGPDLLDATIRGLTPAAVAEEVLNEIGEHDVRLDLTFDGVTTSHLRPEADVVVSLGLADAVRALYGGRPWSSLAVSTPNPEVDERGISGWFAGRKGIPQSVQGLLSALRPARPDLGELAVELGSDKWGDMHWYTQHYERHFARLRTEPVRVLEIGIGGYDDPDSGGGSLRMWERFFPRGLVLGLDIAEKNITGPRIMTVRGDQSDAGFLDRLGRELGPFDVVIDDGSHLNDHVRTSFHALFPHVRAGGLYVVEDLQTAYWPSWGGHPEGADGTSTGMLKSFVDGLNHAEVGDPRAAGSFLQRNISGISFHHNIAFVEKGTNAEEGGPEFLRTLY